MERIGVIGLGRMGSAIALRMAKNGKSVIGWTRSGRRVKGVQSTTELETLVDNSDTLILSLFDDTAVSTTLDVLLTYKLTGKQIIETSTVMPNNLKERIDQIETNGATAVDAPISGGPELVEAGKCGIFIGGEENAAARASASLATISGRIAHVGPLGTGLVMKVINNSMLQIYLNGLVEMMPLAKRAGLPLETTLRILCGGPAGMPMITDRMQKILGSDEEVGFPVNAAFKDNTVFQNVIRSFGLTSPMLANFGSLRTVVNMAGLSDHDLVVLVKQAYDNADDVVD